MSLRSRFVHRPMSSNATTLTELLIRERPALLRLVQRILGSDGGAEDVIQSIWFNRIGSNYIPECLIDNSHGLLRPVQSRHHQELS